MIENADELHDLTDMNDEDKKQKKLYLMTLLINLRNN
jgi:hypothetical protein